MKRITSRMRPNRFKGLAFERISTPVGYGIYDTSNHLWICFETQTHKNVILKNNSINNYNMDYSKYHYLNALGEDEEEYEKKVIDNIFHVYSQDLLPIDHVNYLENLKNIFNIEPDVIYDIGSAVLHWERHAKRLWKDADIYCFDAFDCLRELYKKTNVNYTICCLGNKDNCQVK